MIEVRTHITPDLIDGMAFDAVVPEVFKAGNSIGIIERINILIDGVGFVNFDLE